MRPRPLLSLLMETVDVRLELCLVDPPDASAADLDRRELARAHERVDLGNADAEVGRDVLQGEEARLNGGAAPPPPGTRFRAHPRKLAPPEPEILDLNPFAVV